MLCQRRDLPDSLFRWDIEKGHARVMPPERVSDQRASPEDGARWGCVFMMNEQHYSGSYRVNGILFLYFDRFYPIMKETIPLHMESMIYCVKTFFNLLKQE